MKLLRRGRKSLPLPFSYVENLAFDRTSSTFVISKPTVLYTNELKNWIFGKAGAKSLNQQSGAEAAQPETVERCRRVQNLGCRLCQKSNFSVHLCIDTTFFLFETAQTHHYLGHFFHLLEHIVGLWSFYGASHFKEVGLIVLAGDQKSSLAWEGPNQINQHLLKALFPKAEINTWDQFLQKSDNLAPLGIPLSFQKAVISDRSLTFQNSACMKINKMLGACRHLLCKQALQQFADQVHDYAATPIKKTDTLRVTYLKRPLPRALAFELEVALIQSIAQFNHLFLRVENFNETSFQQQMHIIGNTDILISVHGNGLSHTLFLPPHARVIEIFPPASHALDYRIFADARGIDYTGIIADRGLIEAKEAYDLGQFGDLNRGIETMNFSLILEKILCV